MGVYHFAGLGKSPGAVTSGLAYLKHERASSFEVGDIVEAVVVFTSPEVARGQEPAFPMVWNEYGKRHPARSSPQLPAEAVEIVGRFLQRELPVSAFYCVETNVTTSASASKRWRGCCCTSTRPGAWASTSG